MATKKLSKEELKNILNHQWEERRAAAKVRSVKNSQRTKKWKCLEQNNELHLETVKRFKHYLKQVRHM